MIKKALLATMAAAMLIPLPAMADNSFAAHESLWNTIPTIGVSVQLNNPKYCRSGNDGVYSPRDKTIVICQDNATGRGQVDWTENDLDTLRHEAQHIVQDCAAGGIGDGYMGRLFPTQDELIEFIHISGLSEDSIKSIIAHYSAAGLDEKGIWMELEAFATAYSVEASMIETKLIQFCSVK